MTKAPLNRRSFIKITALAGGGMVVAFNIDGDLFAQGPPRRPDAGERLHQVHARRQGHDHRTRTLRSARA